MDFSALNPSTSSGANLAARADDARALARLVGRGGLSPNGVDNRGWGALHEAAAAGSCAALRYLLRHPRLEPTALTHEGHSALLLAVRARRTGAARLLLRRAPQLLELATPEGARPLHEACSGGGDGDSDARLAQLLMAAGAELQPRDADGDTPLHEAARSKRAPLVAALLHAGAEPEPRNSFGLTPFLLACLKGSLDCVRELLPFTTDLNARARDGNTGLMLAAGRGSLDVIDFLLECGADAGLLDDEGASPLRSALTRGHPEAFLRLLPATPASAIDRDLFNRSCKPLYFSTEVVLSMLESDLGPEFFNAGEAFRPVLDETLGFRLEYETSPPLCSILNVAEYFCRSSADLCETALSLLLSKGVAVDAEAPDECPPLVYLHCCDHALCHPQVVRLLIERGCDVDRCTMPADRSPRIPDAILASVASGGRTLPTLLRASLAVDPEQVVRELIERDEIGRRISVRVLSLTLPMCFLPAESSAAIRRALVSPADDADREAFAEALAALEPRAPPLRHLCRKAIRARLRTRNFSTPKFFDALDRLRLPRVLTDYLRFS